MKRDLFPPLLERRKLRKELAPHLRVEIIEVAPLLPNVGRQVLELGDLLVHLNCQAVDLFLCFSDRVLDLGPEPVHSLRKLVILVSDHILELFNLLHASVHPHVRLVEPVLEACNVLLEHHGQVSISDETRLMLVEILLDSVELVFDDRALLFQFLVKIALHCVK